ncbi:MAG TPA: hypothetical protein VK909_13895 [Anaerolineales bacterium]|nr:hypothetical protein [Anaerolineales bacterium]
MEKNHSTSLLQAVLRVLRTIFISILGGALTGVLAAVIGSFFNIER